MTGVSFNPPIRLTTGNAAGVATVSGVGTVNVFVSGYYDLR